MNPRVVLAIIWQTATPKAVIEVDKLLRFQYLPNYVHCPNISIIKGQINLFPNFTSVFLR